jgi:hypothetical protein
MAPVALAIGPSYDLANCRRGTWFAAILEALLDHSDVGGPNVHRSGVLLIVFVTGILLTLWAVPALCKHDVHAEEEAQTPKLAPVDRSMHEFMEYFFQPTYQRLKPAMASAPTDNARWRSIKSDAMILAEGGNLLQLRTPPRDPAKWNTFSVAVRDTAAQLYKAARKKDFEASRKSYELMLESCNACHKQFAGGKHILAP